MEAELAVSRRKEAHIWERDEHDWYVEPFECSLALFASETFEGPVHDPAAGLGRIVQSAAASGLQSWGSDLVRRTPIIEGNSNFLTSKGLGAANIVCNPPFRDAEAFVQKAINTTDHGRKIAMLLPLVWMAGFSSKRDWLPLSPLKRIFPISPRPSMPPGRVIEAGIRPGNGTKDFAWFVWEIGFTGAPELAFLNTKAYKRHGLKDRFMEERFECELPLAV